MYPCPRHEGVERSALDAGEWETSRSGRSNSEEEPQHPFSMRLTPRKNPSTSLVRGLVRPRAGMDSFGKHKLSCYFLDSDPGQSIP